jgi:hypothetical protein
MGGIRFEGLTGTVAEVDSANNVHVVLNKDTATAGYAVMMSEKDPGAVTGTPYVTAPEVSEDYRLRVGIDTILFRGVFNHAGQDINRFQHQLSTGSITYAGGYAVIASTTAANQGAMLKTWAQFPIVGTAQTWVEMDLSYSAILTTSHIMEFGLGLPTTAIAAMPDGVFFRYSAGELLGVTNYNGTERLTAAFPALSVPEVGVDHKYSIAIGPNEVEFWIDDVLYAHLAAPTAKPGVVSAASQPFFARVYSTAITTVQNLNIGAIVVSLGDVATSKPWADQCAGAGYSAVNANLTGSTANWANSAVPATVVPTNLAASYATLGGQFLLAAAATAETDLILFAYLVPVSTPVITGRTLYITEVYIDSVNTGATVAGTPTIMQWGLGVGSSAVTFATTDGAASKAARRMPLGVQSWVVGALAGQGAESISRQCRAPLVVNPGEYVHVFFKWMVGTATASQVIRGVVGINGYWE